MKLDGCNRSMAFRFILEEVVNPLDSEAVTIISCRVMLSGCSRNDRVVSRVTDRGCCKVV